MIHMINTVSLDELNTWYKYANDIITSCGGICKSLGYVLWQPNGSVVMCTEDLSWLYIIRGVKPGNIYAVFNIKDFKSCKDDVKDLYNLRILGINSIHNTLVSLESKYSKYICGEVQSIYENDNMMAIPGFETALLSKASDYTPTINIYDNNNSMYKIFASKTLVPLNKGDCAKMYMYNDIDDNNPYIKIIRYMVHKKKLNLDINILTRQLQLIR